MRNVKRWIAVPSVAVAVIISIAVAAALLTFGGAASADGAAVEVSIVEYVPGASGFDGEGFTMTGNWEFPSAASTCTDGNALSYTGTFTRFVWYGEANDNAGAVDVYIDGVKWATVKNNRGESGNMCVMYTSDILERKEHTFKLECRGGGWMAVSKLVVYDDPFDIPYSEIIDDADERFSYAAFGAYTDQSGLHNETVHSARDKDATASLTLDDVRQLTVYADGSGNRGIADFYIDGILVRSVDMYNGAVSVGSYPVFVSDVLGEGTHTLKIVCRAESNKNATGHWIAVDKVAAYFRSAPPPPPLYTDIDDASLGFEGDGWTAFNGLDASYYMKSAHSTDKAGASFSVALTGATSIKLYASKSNDRGTAEIYLNGEYVGDVDEYSAVYTDSGAVWDSGPLPKGEYTFKLVTTGLKQPQSGNTWIEIDKLRVEGIEQGDSMIIHSANTSFITYTAGAALKENADATCGKYASMSAGEGFTATFRGTECTLIPFDTGKPWTAELTVDGVAETISSADVTDAKTLDLSDAVMHRLVLTVTEGEFGLDRITTDDTLFVSLEADMRIKALAEIEERKNGTRKVSDPSDWIPIAYSAEKPTGGVTLSGGVLGDMFGKNTRYFKDSIKKQNYVDVTEWWVSTLQNSNEGRILAGLSNTLNWIDVPEFETELAALLQRIRARQLAYGNGYALSYDESVLGGNTDPSADERRNYDRAMFVKGLVLAGNYYDNKGVAVKDNLAYTVLREFTDWYNYNENKYGEKMLEGVVGVQGHPASTHTYFTPVGKTEDMTYAELCYIQDWWIEYLTDGIPEAVYKYPLNRPHNYLMTGMDSYLDHYRATGDKKYLDACLGYWNIMHEYFMHEGGAAAICEFNTYLPGSRHLDSANHTGELCGTAFWIDYNYKLLQLFPDEEKYALEVEKGIYNIMRGAQGSDGKLRYHQRYNGKIEVALNTNTCCEINGSNLLSRLPEFVYLINDCGVRINLYDGSALDVTRNGKRFALTQTADILKSDKSVVTVTGDAMKLTLRVPSWCKSFGITVNGNKYDGNLPSGGGYVTLDVENGDVVEITAEKELTAVDYDGATQVKNKTRHAFMYGPVLMAAVVDSDSYYDFKFTVHGKDTDGTDEYAIDTDMSLDDFMSKLEPLGNGRWAYTENGEQPFKIIPYGELERDMFFSTYPLFGHTEEQPLPPVDTVTGNTKDVTFDTADGLKEFEQYSSSPQYGATVKDGALVTSAGAEQKFMFSGLYDNGEISVRLKLKLARGRAVNAGIYFNASHPGDGRDKINALNLQAESSGNTVKLNLYEFGAQDGYIGSVCTGAARYLTGNILELELVIKDRTVKGYINGALSLEKEFGETLGLNRVGIRSMMAQTEIICFSVTNSQVRLPDPDEGKTCKVVIYNGNTVVFDKTVERGTAVLFVPLQAEGYTFAGLFADAEFGTPAEMPASVTEDITLYAKYDKIPGGTDVPETPGVASSDGGLSAAAVAAIACATEAAVVALGIAAYILIKKKRKTERTENK